MTNDDYADMAADYEANPIRHDEVGDVEVRLPAGRPAGGGPARGRTPTTSVRFPQPIRDRLNARADAEDVKPAEIIRRAVVEYLDRHAV
ncbi:hypothetical protein HUN08_01105 [Gordonia sp. X0973]|uniref:ribbon-helix-helix domain-containing protein n=1 Tax=Gordonia sp. X0973 TaxID=2742602 RepID=UPI000F53580A|nr:CopG family transcriptional regulator [Gordonia sp. X0973]QKT05943.1 hypothetical protein HUN08_01105 [Gordonia sp. X0973]